MIVKKHSCTFHPVKRVRATCLKQYSGMGDDIVAEFKNGEPGNESVQTGPGHFKRPLLVYFKSHNDIKTLTVKSFKNY